MFESAGLDYAHWFQTNGGSDYNGGDNARLQTIVLLKSLNVTKYKGKNWLIRLHVEEVLSV